jgi:hypothetical protein
MDVATLRQHLHDAEARLEQLESARQRYEQEIQPYIDGARAAVENAIPRLDRWRKNFHAAVGGFHTDKVGSLGRSLAEIETELYPALERLTGAAYHSKRRELGLPNTREGRLEAQGPCDAAAKAALAEVGANDLALLAFPSLRTETAKDFAKLIMNWLSDQNIKIYNPRLAFKMFAQ